MTSAPRGRPSSRTAPARRAGASRKPAAAAAKPKARAARKPKGKRCTAKTAKGKRCLRAALEGTDVCPVHIGAPVGRPTKLDEETIGRIIEVLRFGGYVEMAAAAAGVSRTTFHEWMQRGDPDGTAKADAACRDFRQRVEKARAEGEAHNVELVARAAAKDWKAAAWLLERGAPDRWAGPRGRKPRGLADPDEPPGASPDDESSPRLVDDQVGPDGRPL